MYRKYVKRMIDFLLALLALLFLSPVLLIVAILVRTKLGSPIIFKQQRPGKDEKIFCLYKFRTMTDERNAKGELLPDEKRLTKFGKLLRSTSLDELPELINILKGEMSFVGPRPLLVKYLPLYDERQRKRHLVRPGLTGYAQVNGRNTITWEERFEMDIHYIHQVSFAMDIKIMIQTILKVLKREGISSDNSVTMEEFRGKIDNESSE